MTFTIIAILILAWAVIDGLKDIANAIRETKNSQPPKDTL
jgi:hypothetical protein